MSLAKSGDIIVFSNKGKDAMIIKGWSDSPWTHVGVVYRDPKTNVAYLWHCDPIDYRRDAVTNRYKKGAQLNLLETYIYTFKGKMIFGQLSKPINNTYFENAIKAMNKTKFNHNCVDLLRCTMEKGGGIFGSYEGKLSQMFCSEFAAVTYFLCNVFGDSIPFNEYHPKTFLKHDFCDWKNEYEFSEKWLIK